MAEEHNPASRAVCSVLIPTRDLNQTRSSSTRLTPAIGTRKQFAAISAMRSKAGSGGVSRIWYRRSAFKRSASFSGSTVFIASTPPSYRSSTDGPGHKLRIRRPRREVHRFLPCLARGRMTLDRGQSLAQPIKKTHAVNANFSPKVSEPATSCFNCFGEAARQDESVRQLAKD